jgi:hypothetical protein
MTCQLLLENHPQSTNWSLTRSKEHGMLIFAEMTIFKLRTPTPGAN